MPNMFGSSSALTRQRLLNPVGVHGYVHWELIDSITGKVTSKGKGKIESRIFRFLPNWLSKLLPLGDRNAIVDYARGRLANAVIGTSVTFPQYIAIGTGTNAVAASDTDLQTLVQYDGANDAKIANSRTLKGLYTSRVVGQFTTGEAIQNIRELGLFDAANAPRNLWARVRVTINKASTERLNVYWYIIFERRTGLAIKTGASIGATGSITANTTITLTFASAVSILMINNRSGVIAYFKLNEALVGSPPENYDFILDNNEEIQFLNEEIEVSTVHVYMNDTITMPDNQLTVRGW